MTTLRPLHIIMADDDTDDRDLFAEAAAETEAIVIRNVENGMELLEALGNTIDLPDLILLDLNMPVKGGKECLEEIRSDKKYAALPVVIYSTSMNKKDIAETYELGANLYLPKPNSFAELKKIVKILKQIDWNKHQPKMHQGKFVLRSQDLDEFLS
jgi:CheY-like chemotaxis protein